MKETFHKLRSSDRHLIYGTLFSPTETVQKLVIFAHGYGGFQNEHQFFNSAPFFALHGIATFRFNFYGNQKRARLLHKSNTANHVHDTNTVIAYFRSRYKRLYLVGHSLGAVVVLLSDMANVSAVVLWDPLGNPDGKGGIRNKKEAGTYNEELDAYIPDYGPACLINKYMYTEWENLASPKELVQNVSAPLKIISASKSHYLKSCRAYYKYARAPKAYAKIKGASHCFIEYGKEQILFKETLDWIEAH